MKKNNKGFFLAETIVVIALVTTIMAFVYPNISNLYDNYNNRTKYYDQTEDLYLLRAFSDYLYQKYEDDKGDGNSTLKDLTDNGCENFKSENNDGWDMVEVYTDGNFSSCYDGGGGSCKNITKEIVINTDLKYVYITNYMATPTSDDYNFNRYLRRMRKSTYDSTSYRLIGVFESDGNTRYASIKIDNPNPNRSCNLGGE